MITPPVITALDDWKRLCVFDFGASFSEFQPDPPAAIPTISARTIENTSGVLTLGTPSGTGGTTISLFVSGGVAGNSYELKCKATLASGLKLSIPAIYTVVAPGTVIQPIQFDHLIDPLDDTTWTRDYVFDFSGFDEFVKNPALTIVSANFVGISGVSAIAQNIVGMTVIVRIFCSTPGLDGDGNPIAYPIRAQAVLSDGTQLSVPGLLNAVLGSW